LQRRAGISEMVKMINDIIGVVTINTWEGRICSAWYIKTYVVTCHFLETPLFGYFIQLLFLG